MKDPPFYKMRHFFRTRAHWPYAPAARNIDIGGQGALQSDAHPGVIYFANTGVDVPLLFSEINMFLLRAGCGCVVTQRYR